MPLETWIEEESLVLREGDEREIGRQPSGMKQKVEHNNEEDIFQCKEPPRKRR